MSCNRELATEAIRRLASGTPLVVACRDLNIPRSTFYHFIGNESDLLDMLARAREEYAESIVCEMREIAETVEDVGRAKLLCDNIKWEASRMAPKKYGDRIENRHTDGDGNNLTVQVVQFGTNNPTR